MSDGEVTEGRDEAGASDPVLAEWVEELNRKLQAGEPVDIEAYAREHPERAEQLRRLLPAIEMMAGLGRSLAPGSAPGAAPGPDPFTELRVLGDYRIVREIGRGGMGVVYEARQVSLGRRVALKVLPFASALDPRHLQRFQVEAQAAACLHHANIVPVHAVGTERGVSYYAMQYIEGRNLAEVIRELRQLDGLEEPAPGAPAVVPGGVSFELASGLFDPPPPGVVGDASTVAHSTRTPGAARDAATTAPATGPSDAETVAAGEARPPASPPPQPTPAAATGRSSRSRAFFRTAAHLGLQAAEALDHAHEEGVLHRDIKPANLLIDGRGKLWVTDFGLALLRGGSDLTATGDILGTLRYMSPEQALAKRVVIDGRTDVYSLGVTLYELLTLHPVLDGRDRADLLRRIAHEEPRPLRRLNPAVPVDLETIVLKAMAKETSGRYATARELADDLRRFLEDQPIRARRPTLLDRAAKWSRRHKPVVASAAVLLILAVVGLSIGLVVIAGERAEAVWQARRAAAAAAEARQRTDESRQVVDFLVNDVFKAPIPGRGQSRQNRVGELLDRAESVVEHRFPKQPLVEASVRMALAQYYRGVYDRDRAVKHARRASEIRERHLGPEHPETLRALEELATCLRWNSSVAAYAASAEASPIVRRVLEARRRVLGPSHPETLGAQSFLAYLLLESHLDEATALAADAETIALRALGPDHPTTLAVWDCLGHVYARRGDLARAEAVRRQCYLGRERLLGPLDPDTIGALENLAKLLRERGRLDEARRLYLEVVHRNDQVHGPTHIQGSFARWSLIEVLRQQGDHAAMRDVREGWLRKILATDVEADPYERERRVLYLTRYASALAELPEGLSFDADLAVRAAEEAVALDPGACSTLAQVYARLGRFDLAAQRLAEGARRSAGDPRELNNIAWFLATCPVPQLRDPARAVELARKAVEMQPQAWENWNTLGVARYRAGHWKEAIEALEKSQQLSPDGGSYEFFFLAMAHWQLGEKEPARRWYGRAVEWMAKKKPGDDELRRFRAEAAALLGLEDEPPPTEAGVPTRKIEESKKNP